MGAASFMDEKEFLTRQKYAREQGGETGGDPMGYDFGAWERASEAPSGKEKGKASRRRRSSDAVPTPTPDEEEWDNVDVKLRRHRDGKAGKSGKQHHVKSQTRNSPTACNLQYM